MKFEKEPLTTDFISRRVREEYDTDPSRRRVTRVLLEPKEWTEFLLNWDHRRFDYPPRNVMIHIAVPTWPYGHSALTYNDPVWTVEVRPA